MAVPDEGEANEHLSQRSSLSFDSNYRQSARDYQLAFLSGPDTGPNAAPDESIASAQPARNTPIFSGKVLDGMDKGNFKQYGLLCKAIATSTSQRLPASMSTNPALEIHNDPRIFLNVLTPWSAFICGSQGSGKSHTLSCMLENCLMSSRLGELRAPLAAMVFHYDTFSSYGSRQLCEVAYLCSAGIPVKVLVSPTNAWRMKETYESLPLSSPHARKPQVMPMKFQEKHLDVSKIMSLMAVGDKDGPTPLYIEVRIEFSMFVQRILLRLTGHPSNLTGHSHLKSGQARFRL